MTRLRLAPDVAPPGNDERGGNGGDEFVLEFAGGLPGFHDLRRFAVAPLGPELEPFSRMTSLETPDLEFIVVPPGVLFPDYQVEVDEDSVERLSLTAESAVVLLIVTLAEANGQPSANLLGPIVINRETHAAMQVVQHGSNYGVAVPLLVGAGEGPGQD
ncbi:MAG: flagellar assembly protein FliW [Acidimicrobiales bacterium]